jgi:hypothetical protein
MQILLKQHGVLPAKGLDISRKTATKMPSVVIVTKLDILLIFVDGSVANPEATMTAMK